MFKNNVNRIECNQKCCIFYTWNYDSKVSDSWQFKDTVKAGCILMNENNQILLVQSRGNKLGFPKGNARSARNDRKLRYERTKRRNRV